MDKEIIEWEITDGRPYRFIDAKGHENRNHSSNYAVHYTRSVKNLANIVKCGHIKSIMGILHVCFTENPYFYIGETPIGFLYDKEVLLQQYDCEVLGDESYNDESEIRTREKVLLEHCIGIILYVTEYKKRFEEIKKILEGVSIPIYIKESLKPRFSGKLLYRLDVYIQREQLMEEIDKLEEQTEANPGLNNNYLRHTFLAEEGLEDEWMEDEGSHMEYFMFTNKGLEDYIKHIKNEMERYKD